MALHVPPQLSGKQAYILYLCHLLSAWNARSYAAVILFEFMLLTFPDHLLRSSAPLQFIQEVLSHILRVSPELPQIGLDMFLSSINT
jgi:hypothetical protein